MLIWCNSNEDWKTIIELHANKIYAYICKKHGYQYVEFLQQKLSEKKREIFEIIIADIYDYFCEHVNSYESIYENLSIKEINESEYINDEIFVEYAFDKFTKSYNADVNLKYLIKSIFISIFDVNENFKYAFQGKNKDADPRIKILIAKYTYANIKITPNVAKKASIKTDKSITISEFYELYENYKQNQIKKFEDEENDVREEIKLTQKDLLVYFYLKSFSKKYVDIKIEEIARDCKTSEATVSRIIKKLEKAGKIKIRKIGNKNIYEIIDYKEKETSQASKKEKMDKNDTTKSGGIEIQTSELDYKRYRKNEKIDANTRYKLYLYRQKYAEELKNLQLKRLTKDDVLFFLINSEPFIENESLTLQQVLKIIKYADSNLRVRNPVGWLIERFGIGKGRFYFLLSRSKSEELTKDTELTNPSSYENLQKEEQNLKDNSIYIRQDLLHLAEKYRIQQSEIVRYIRNHLGSSFSGDASFIAEQYIANWLWKNYLSREQKRELIQHARREIRKFIVPPKPEEIESYMKSIIRNEIRSRYLTLSIEDKIRLFSRKQHHNLHHQYCDTS